MPTINQLVREGRTQSVKKSNSPALLRGMNSLKRVPTEIKAPQKRGCLVFECKKFLLKLKKVLDTGILLC